MTMGKNVIAAFDLDGTLTNRDTFLHLLIRTFGYIGLVKGLCANTFNIFKYQLGLTSNHDAKEAFFSHFFKGLQVEDFERLCRAYSINILPGLIRKEAVGRYTWHLERGHQLVIVSASIRNWIEPWALRNGFTHVIATEVEVDRERITGRFNGRNCSGDEKVKRFKAIFPERENFDLFAYGNSRGDEALLNFADHAYYRRFS
jgi:HAD superfamily hydrolase (TIGR01490 family)